MSSRQQEGPATSAVPMYKLARKPVPQYVDASPPVLNRLPQTMNEDSRGPSPDPSYYQPRVAPPSTSSRFRIFSSLDEAKITQIRYSRHSDTFYPPNMGRVTTGTQDLAEFFKESGPGDFRKPGEETPMAGSRAAGAPKKSRFLKVQTFKDSSEKSRAVPAPSIPHVISKTTSKGKPYLQIHVDYVPPQRSSSESPVELAATSYNPTRALPSLNSQEQKVAVQLQPPRNVSSPTGTDNRTFRSFTPQSGRQTPASTTGSPNQTGSPQIQERSNGTLSPSFDGSDRQDRSSVGSVDGGASYYLPSTQRSSLSNTYRHSNTPEPQTRSPMSVDIPDSVYQSSRAESPKPNPSPYIPMRAPPRPGPPPSRGLPSLPEATDSMPPSMYPSPALSSVNSENGFTIASDRQRREERVKARKARDMLEMQARQDRRMSNPSTASLASSITHSAIARNSSNSGSTSPTSSAKGSTTKPPAASASPEMLLLQGSAQGDAQLQAGMSLAQMFPTPGGSPLATTATGTTTTTGNASTTGSANHLNPGSRPRQVSVSTTISASTTPPRSPSSSPAIGVASLGAAGGSLAPTRKHTKKTRSATVSSRSEARTARELELEHRLEVLEQKSMILEQALITVLQRTSPHSESNSIENLLAGFRITYPCRGWSDPTLPPGMEMQSSSPKPSPRHHHHHHHQQQHQQQTQQQHQEQHQREQEAMANLVGSN
ncbi:hypothetical protein DFH27DRAFT_606393 [Peziza echinospora]|nr:hypothetical protein DFH27DRAFT_606393 [Peziza echinospora]